MAQPPISIRTMQARGALCLTVYCHSQGIRHPDIIELLDHLLDLLTATDLPTWEATGTQLALCGRGDPLPEEVEASVPPGLRHEFFVLVGHVVEIGLTDMYGAPSHDPKRFLLKAIETLNRHRLQVPDIDDLLPAGCLDNATEDAWGEPISPEASINIRKHCLDLMRG